MAATAPPLHIEDKNATDILDVVRYCRRKGKQVLDTAAEKSSPHAARAAKAIAMAARDAAPRTELQQPGNGRRLGPIQRGVGTQGQHCADTRGAEEVFVAHASTPTTCTSNPP